jgi:hypothetical protein
MDEYSFPYGRGRLTGCKNISLLKREEAVQYGLLG